MKLTILLVLAVPASERSAVFPMPDRGRPAQLQSTTRRQGKERPEETAVINEINRLREVGLRAQMKGDHHAAVQAFQRALRLDPTDVVLLEELAVAYDLNGQLTEARRAYRKAMLRRPNQSGGDARNLARYGELCEKAGDFTEAARAYRAACSSWVYNDGEVPVYARTTDLSGLRAGAFGRAGIRSKSHGDDLRADRELRTAASSDPKNWAVHYHFGLVLNMRAQYRAADREFEEAQKLGGGGSQAISIQRSILSARLSKPRFFATVDGKSVELRNAKALAIFNAKLQRKPAKYAPATPHQLEQALKGIRMAKAQFAKDPTKVKELENAERNIQAALNKAKPAK